MKTCFKIHPDDYDKRANEKFYEKMAEEGWILKKRWNNLSKFEKSEPQNMKFDIYYSEYNYVSEEERQEFHSKGRTIVDVKSNVHVSYAPVSEHLPPVMQINEDTAKAIIPLKNKKSILPYPVVLMLMLNFLNDIKIKFTYNSFSSLPFPEEWLYKVITMPELYIAILIPAVYIVFLSIYEHIRWKKALSSFHNGENPDDGSKKKVLYISSFFMVVVTVAFTAFFTVSNFTIKEQEMPEFSDGMYLDVHDFGIEDIIAEKGIYIGDKFFSCGMIQRKTLSSQMCLTHEYYRINDSNVFIFQDIIKYKSAELSLYAAELLAKDKHKNYSEITTEGFEKVYVSPENLIAVIDSTVYRVSIITTDDSIVPSDEKLLDSILSKNK